MRVSQREEIAVPPWSSPEQSRLGSRVAFNYLTLLLRFGNIFYLVCAPLLGEKHASILTATPLVGASGLFVLFILLTSERASIMIIRWSPAVDGLVGGLFISTFALGIAINNILVHYILAFSLGAGLAATEAGSLRFAIRNPSSSEMRSSLAVFNGLKVVGVALGFLLAGLIAETNWAAVVARCMVGLMGCALIAFAILAGSAFSSSPRLFGDEASVKTTAIHWPRFWLGLICVIVDLTIFTFWYAYIPYKVGKVYGYSTGTVGFFMALQAIVHALAQPLWSRGLHRIGEKAGYLISQCLHVVMICVITKTVKFDIPVYLFLFSLMGLVNSGTYIASATILYSSGWPPSLFRRIGFHQGASNLGKFLGAGLASVTISQH